MTARLNFQTFAGMNQLQSAGHSFYWNGQQVPERSSSLAGQVGWDVGWDVGMQWLPRHRMGSVLHLLNRGC